MGDFQGQVRIFNVKLLMFFKVRLGFFQGQVVILDTFSYLVTHHSAIWPVKWFRN